MLFFVLLSRLPLWWLYRISDLLFLFAYYLIGYRKSLVVDNLRRSFPDKSEAEIRQIAKQYYRHLTDLIVETLKVLSLKPDTLRKRFQVKNIELVQQKLDAGQSVVIMTSHHCNWEWLSLITSLHQPYPIDAVYQPLSNPFFDRLMLRIRTHFGAKPVRMQMILKNILQHKGQARITALLADQNPFGKEVYWTEFLHRDTCFFLGGEKIARKMQFPMVFGGARKLRRGYYELYFEDIPLPDAQAPEGALIEQYIRKLEAQIQNDPAHWLWTHRRWKRSREAEKKALASDF